MERIINIARHFGIAVVEDCAQAHGALYKGHHVGTIGDAAAFSFYPTKNLGAMGDGGAVVTSDPVLAERCRLIKQYGWKCRYISEISGMNTRLDEVQAAVLRIKLKYLDEQNKRRYEIAKRYCEYGKNRNVYHPIPAPETDHVYHQYVIQSEQRDLLQQHLLNCGVGTAILYPIPVHRQPGYFHKVSIGFSRLEETDKLCQRILCLPIYPELNEQDCDKVIMGLKTFELN
jgi:dTDP-4-amino-4,6-dideoxygalactose transaminase